MQEELTMAVKKRKHIENSECLKSYFDQIKKSKLLTFDEEIFQSASRLAIKKRLTPW
jgi:hypothetical protein